MKANATLLVNHFHWDTGTRVRVTNYWISKDNVTILFPPCEASPHGGKWTFAARFVKIDSGVELEVEGELPRLKD